MQFSFFHFLGLSLLFVLSVKADTLEPAVRIFFSANRQGEIEPCGCQVNQIGGLNRFKAYLDEDKRKIPTDALLVDSGDTFFSVNPLTETRRKPELSRARVIARAYQMMKLDALTPGERDFAGGIDGLRELQILTGATFLTTNLVDKTGKPLFERTRIVNRGGLKIGLFSLSDEKAFSGITDVKVLPPGPVLKQVVEEFRNQKVDKVVLLSHLGLIQDREIAGMGGIDVILGSHSMDILPSPEVVNGVGIMQPQNEGQQLGVFDLYAASGKYSGFLVDLSKKYDVKNSISTLMSHYKAEVREIALSQGNSPANSTKARPYVAHPNQCRQCHAAQYDWWEKTKHASAYLVLYAKNQLFDPECIGCHSVGFQKEGGFQKMSQPIVLKEDKKNPPYIEQLMKKVFASDPGEGPLDSRTDPKRYEKLKATYHQEINVLEKSGKILNLYAGVQCENCHGNRQGHPGVLTQKKVSTGTCLECHKAPNAPVWDEATVEKKLKEIGCPARKTS